MNAFYKVHAGGPVFDKCKTHVDQHSAANKAAVAWSKKHNLPATHVSETTVWFESTYLPDKNVWNKAKRGGYKPRAKTEKGAELIEELQALPRYPSLMQFVMGLVENRQEFDFTLLNETGWPGMEKNKSEDFYRLHIDPRWLPTDRTGVVEITASEYEAKAA